MSRMSELSISIEELLAEGLTPQKVAEQLRIPVEWVDSVEDAWLDSMAGDAVAFADADAYYYGMH
jgi:hypothetical protein